MTVTHTVLLRFKPGVSQNSIDESLGLSISMKEKCVHAVTGKPYIISAVAGKNLGIIENEHGFTHVIQIEFANAEECKYFIREDPEHLKIFPTQHEVIDEVLVMDFIPGGLGA
ncbi:hypothetical protein F4810DRAFT_718642 [Camillea tinctor]|nr:hypothetical protein F4810DRAFT_718642 [Camillea tinctor]